MATIEKKEHNLVEISLEATREEFEAALMKSYNKNKKKFQVPGFRKGKVPYQLVVKYYGEAVLYEDAIDDIANEQYVAAIKENDLQVVSRPDMDVKEIGENGLKYVISVYVKPEVELGQYEGVEVVYSCPEITDADVDAEIERMRNRNSSIEEVDRAIEDGDTAIIDFEGFKDGVAFEGGKGENYTLKIGSHSFIPGFEEQLIGHAAGEEFPIEVTFPEDYQSEDLKGAAATFNIKIHTVKATILPELDDEFVKDVSEFDTLDELKADIKKNQEEAAKKNADAMFENDVVKAVSENATIDIPEAMIENECAQMAQEQAARLEQQGIQMDLYLQYTGQTPEDFKASLMPMAEQRTRANLVIEKIASELKIEATAEEMDEELQKMADAYKMSLDDIKAAIGEDNAMVKDSIVGQKTVKYLASKAVKTAPNADAEA